MNSGLFGAWRRGERRPAALGKLRAGAHGCPSPIYHLPAKPYPCETRDFKKQPRAGKISPFFPAPAQPLTPRQPLDASCRLPAGEAARCARGAGGHAAPQQNPMVRPHVGRPKGFRNTPGKASPHLPFTPGSRRTGGSVSCFSR